MSFAPIRTVLHQTDAFEVISIQWSDQSYSPVHEHGWSQCLVLIEEGLFEDRLDLGMKQETRILEVGQVLSTPMGGSHSLHCKSRTGRTLHVYTPKQKAVTSASCFSGPRSDKWKEAVSLSTPIPFEALEKLFSSLRDQSISVDSPYFMNQLFSGIHPQMLLAEDFINQTKATMATQEASPVHSAIECEVVDSLCELIGWDPKQSGGVSVPGGSAANFMAITSARHQAFPGLKQTGSGGVGTLKVFVSAEAHYSFKKACALLGIGTDHLISVPVDDSGRMNTLALDEMISQARSSGVPLLVAATAGTTVYGAFDDLEKISEICRKHQVWLHVDAAWGGPVLFSKKCRGLVSGIERADSVTFDAHKLFGANLTTSFFLAKNQQILFQANDVAAGKYLFHSEDPNLDRGKISWQCGRRADAVSFWGIWKNLGSAGLGEFVDRLVGIRDEVLQYIQAQDRLELIADPVYLNVCVKVHPKNRVNDPHWSKVVREKLKEEGRAFVNYSSNEKGTFLRLILAHPFLRVEQVRDILDWALDVE